MRALPIIEKNQGNKVVVAILLFIIGLLTIAIAVAISSPSAIRTDSLDSQYSYR